MRIHTRATIAFMVAISVASTSAVTAAEPETSTETSSTESSLATSSDAGELGSSALEHGATSGSASTIFDSTVVGSSHLWGNLTNPQGSAESVQLSHQELTTNALSSQSFLEFFIAFITGIGSLRNLIFKLQENLHPNWPQPMDPSITEAKLVKKEKTDDPRIERWTVSSPSMQRNITSTVMLPKDASQPSPAVYVYEGVDGLGQSHWFSGNFAQETFADENALLVSPMTARASMYMDWESDDPNLGRYKWETFIMEELSPIVEEEINFNGKRGALGLSMGAGGAVMTGAAHPDFFDAIAAISGCYSTMDPLGRSTIDATVRTRGGDPENMWGPFGSPAWRAHDAVLNAANFANTKLYLFTANGSIPDSALPVYGPSGSFDQQAGSSLEAGTLQCTKMFDEALQEAGVSADIDYADEGAHGWYTFGPQMQPAWNSIRPALVD